jgi:hypothetical protein
MTPVATAVVGFLDDGVAAFGSRLNRGSIAADGCGFRAGHGKAETQGKGRCQKKITHLLVSQAAKSGEYFYLNGSGCDV